MEISASRKNLSDVDEDVLIVPVFEGETPREGALAALDHLTRGAVASVFESGDISGKQDSWALLYNSGALPARRLLLYGAGKQPDAPGLQRIAGTVVRMLASRGVKSAAFLLRGNLDVAVSARAVVEGWLLGQVNSDLYRSPDERARGIDKLSLISESLDAASLDAAINTGKVMAEATNFARMLGNEPGNVMTPTELANRAEAMAAREGLKAEVIGEEQMKRLGMGALLAVSRGSDEPARLITLTYDPEGATGAGRDRELFALVGKGLTFDSGGISIKPAESMDEMKFDMCGGAAVIGAMQVVAQLKPNVRVIGVVPSSENLISGRSYKPGDVVRSFSGKTIEVVNTDAEGRLILADAITYAINLGATYIIDAATLTGACVVALGEVRAGIVGTDQRLIEDLVRAGEQSGERLWQLPFDNEYGNLIRSDIADMKNVGDRTAGAITAGMFLKNFVGSLPWAHLDIAGTAWLDHAKPHMAKGATGFGVRTLSNFLLDRASNPG